MNKVESVRESMQTTPYVPGNVLFDTIDSHFTEIRSESVRPIEIGQPMED